MASIYKQIFHQIIDPDQPDPVVTINHESHLARLRAGLSRYKREYEALLQITEDTSLRNKQFKYTQDKDDPSKVTITLAERDEVPIQLVNPKAK